MLSVLFVYSTAKADNIATLCTNSRSTERLELLCLTALAANGVTNINNLHQLDLLLASQGYLNRFGFVKSPPALSITNQLVPTLEYSQNTNGGNPIGPLILGQFTFSGDQNLVQKEGALLGVRSQFNGRYIYGESRFIDFELGASYAYSPDHNVSATSLSANVCSKNHIMKWWYVDACFLANNTNKDLSSYRSKTLSVTTSKLFTSSAGNHQEAYLGMIRYFSPDYTQNQIAVGLNTKFSNGVFSSLSISTGEELDGQLAMSWAINTSVSTLLDNKLLEVSATHQISNGGLMLGFERAETTSSVNVSYEVTKNLSLSAGYTLTDSTIDYFDVSEPTFGIKFKPVRF